MLNLKKLSLVVLGGFLFGQVAQSQPVSDRGVVPVAVTLNQILRLNIVSGGNQEFVFNTIDDFETGIGSPSGGGGGTPGIPPDFFDTEITIASSTDWELYYGAQDAELQPTDDPGGPTLSLDNIGWTVTNPGNHQCNATGSPPNDVLDCGNWNNNGADAQELQEYPTLHTGSAASGNAGDIDDNNLIIEWEAGTTNGNMNGDSFLDQSVEPDRYVTNVLFDLRQL